MKSNRRDFMKRSGLAVGAGMVGNVSLSQMSFAASKRGATDQPPTLVAIYLRGGADALNIVTPYVDKRYVEIRPTIALDTPDASGPGAVLDLDGRFGLNPNMAGLHRLYQKGQCAPIVAVGSHHTTRSHFDAQDYMERAAPGMRNVNTGWLDRFLSQTQSPRDTTLRAFSLQPLLPRSMRGDYPVLAQPEKSADEAMAMFEHVYKDMPTMRRPTRNVLGKQNKQVITDSGVATIEQLRELNKIVNAPDAKGLKYPASRFGTQMKQIAKVLKAKQGLQVTAMDYRGWDHHINEGPIDGQLGLKLKDLSDGIAAFTDDLGDERMANVMVLVMTEFGRTAKENGNNGSDHGHGGAMLAVGGQVNGGKVYGKWTDLQDKNLYKNRDLPVHTDFRQVFAETLQGVFDYDGIKHGMFPEYTPDAPPLGFINA
jgi:uncharacterized protein (DUF1501 family)